MLLLLEKVLQAFIEKTAGCGHRANTGMGALITFSTPGIAKVTLRNSERADPH